MTRAHATTAHAGFVGRLLRRPLAVVCLAYLFVLIVGCFGAPLLAPSDPLKVDVRNSLGGFSTDHLLGTDQLGRDVLSRLMYGGRPALTAAAVGVLVALLLGVPAGLAAGFLRGWWDRLIVSVGDIAFAFPVMIILLVILSIFGNNPLAAMVGLGALVSPGVMRVVRSATFEVRKELFIDAAQVSGLSRARIVAHHVLPRIAGVAVVQGTLIAAVGVTMITSLDYLGFGVKPPAPTWGSIVKEASTVVHQHASLLFVSGSLITLTVLALGVLGDSARDAATEAWGGTGRSKKSPPARSAELSAPIEPEPPVDPEALLSVRGLSVGFGHRTGWLAVLSGVSFDVYEGESVAIVGESGCGKSVTMRAILGLLGRRGGRVTDGRIIFRGQDLRKLSSGQMARIRGSQISLVSQEPIAALDPVFTVGSLLMESVRRHEGLRGAAARARVVELLGLVRLPDPERVFKRYPHELSGGMAQRVAIARALTGDPELLIADEPTTALDVSVQAEILDLLREIQNERGMSILLVTHDWGVAASLCSRVLVMYAGQIVESAGLSPIVHEPLHPYTEALLGATPSASKGGARRLVTIPGSVPRVGEWPLGCRFQPRCHFAEERCAATAVAMREMDGSRLVRCVRAGRASKAMGAADGL